jgi:hypothetical protein
MNETNQINEINQINQINQTNQRDEMDEIDEINQIDQISAEERSLGFNVQYSESELNIEIPSPNYKEFMSSPRITARKVIYLDNGQKTY